MNVNNVVVVGNLTADPKMNEGQFSVVNFRIASNPWRKNPPDTEAEPKGRVDFIDVECWGQLAVNVCGSLRKGDRVIVTGALKYDSWSDLDGNPRSRLRIRANAVGASLEFEPLRR